MPAILGFVGRNIDRLHIPRLRRTENVSRQGFWYRWSRLVQRRPVTIGLVGLIALVTLTLPLFSMRLGAADAGNDPTHLTTRRAYDLLSEGFGPGFNGPLLLAARIPGPQGLQVLGTLQHQLEQTRGVAAVSPPFSNKQGDTAVMRIYPTTSPQDAATSDLVHKLQTQSCMPMYIDLEMDITNQVAMMLNQGLGMQGNGQR